jgi:hypothetical protein
MPMHEKYIVCVIDGEFCVMYSETEANHFYKRICIGETKLDALVIRDALNSISAVD